MTSYKKDTDSGPGFYVKAAIHPPFSAAAWLGFFRRDFLTNS